MRKPLRTQLDLFGGIRPVELVGVERQKMMALLQALLTEAALTEAGETLASEAREAERE